MFWGEGVNVLCQMAFRKLGNHPQNPQTGISVIPPTPNLPRNFREFGYNKQHFSIYPTSGTQRNLE